MFEFMYSTQFSPSQTSGFEELIEGLTHTQIGQSKRLFSPTLIKGLAQNLSQFYAAGQMHPAGIGKKFSYQQNVEVRGDVIRWIDNDSTNEYEREFLSILQQFIHYLNETCYTNINDFEFHMLITTIWAAFTNRISINFTKTLAESFRL